MERLKFFTIGVYGTTEQSFFDKLVQYQIDTFCDIRNRRGVRGSKYRYVNSKKLQEKLQSLGIKYLHVQDLSPSQEIRDLQKKADMLQGVLKSERTELGFTFKNEYQQRVLAKFDFVTFLNNLKDNGSHSIVLFCVEAEPNACHRSLVANKLHNGFSLTIEHIK